VYITQGSLIFLVANGALLETNINMSAVLDSHTRSIQNIQIVHQDLFPLVAESNKDLQLPSTTINAFGASIQDLFTINSLDEGADFCIFSSWLETRGHCGRARI
jgi:hypothetical protein